jgi:hypothetical protein
MNMVRTAAMLALTLALLPGFAHAQAASSWFKNLYKALTSDTAQKYASQGRSVTSVAAIRGAGMGQQDPAQPYWKGGVSEKAAKQLAEERKAFAEAIQLVMDGKVEEGKASLADFEKKHPNSALLGDVKEAIAKIEAEAPKAETPAEAPAAEGEKN